MEPEEIYGPGVQAGTINIQDGCRTHPGGPSVRARIGAQDLWPLINFLAAQSMVRYHLCGWGSLSADCWKLPPTPHFIIYCCAGEASEATCA